jgi:hypothetical protein
MEILELVGGKPGSNGPLNNKTDFMNLRKLKPRDTLKEKLASAQTSHAAEYQRGIDNLIRGLVELLPQPDGVWPLDDRAKWLHLAADIFDLGFKACDGEDRQIRIAVVKPESRQPVDRAL